ncbi:MAG: aldehyde dehydrogenase family protein, partial [Firmicutes bacterium HGW-Firmicutes-3]
KSNETSIEPTLLVDVKLDSPVMQEEIFGPILPIIAYDNIEEVITYIKSKDRPLAFYLFSTDKVMQKRLIHEISFGGGTFNDTLMHVASSEMGFGGVGASGMGSYHGIHSFNTFSHHKSVLKRANWIDLSFRYHPYTKQKQGLIDKFTK